MFSVCESVCEYTQQNVFLATPFVVGDKHKSDFEYFARCLHVSGQIFISAVGIRTLQETIRELYRCTVEKIH